MTDTTSLLDLLGPFLARQRWYSGGDAPSRLDIIDESTEREAYPRLVRLLVDADGETYQVLVGLRPSDERPDFLRGRDDAVVGEIEAADGRLLAHDATVDSDLGLLLLDIVSGGTETADHVRPVGGEQSNSSLVYDDRLILKVFRRLHPGRNLDVEVTEALFEAGFDHVARPLGTWRIQDGGLDYDLAVLQPFLVGGVDGWALALTSLRDLFGVSDTQQVPIITDADEPPAQLDPAEAGGDFSAEARRLGTITADMHVAMAKAFGEEAGDTREWADRIAVQVEAVRHPAVDQRNAMRIVDALRRVGDGGPAVRVHGDYHLGQVLRTDAGWFVLDFEGEPARPPDERRRKSSPLRDVAGMLRSFHYAAAVAQHERDEDCSDVAAAWETRNRKAFLEGYVRKAERGGILPDPAATEAVLAAFELEKAVYELGYEQAYRPEWESIPLSALQRLAGG
jgi:maltokinase